jgi:type I phosphodiesterase/nucleotide pyrophosphatase
VVPAVRNLLLLPLLATLIGACGDSTASAGQGNSEVDASLPDSNFDGPPVVVVGMDGLEWEVLTPLLKAGKMPNFQALIDRGIAGGLATFQPTFSPVVWTTIATGVPSSTHGVRYFSEVRDGKILEDGLPYTSNTREVPAVWNIVSDQGRDVLSVGWWVSWPAEKVNGRIVASYAAQAQGKLFWKAGVWESGLPKMAYPDSLMDDYVLDHLAEGGLDGPVRSEYEKLFGRIPRPEDPSAKIDPWTFPRERDAFFRTGYHGDRTHLNIFLEQLDRQVADLNLVYFGLPDIAGHFWWRYREPGAFQYSIDDAQLKLLQDRIDQSYIAVDGFLGEIVAKLPQNARIMVLSDHGMHGGNFRNPELTQSGVHEDAPPGVLIAAGPGIRPDGMAPIRDWKYPVQVPGPNGQMRRIQKEIRAPAGLGSVFDITPTVLDWLDTPPALDMTGKSLRPIMTPEWLQAHPKKSVPTYRTGFRAATPPRLPIEGLNEVFQQGLMVELGYQDAKLITEDLEPSKSGQGE